MKGENYIGNGIAEFLKFSMSLKLLNRTTIKLPLCSMKNQDSDRIQGKLGDQIHLESL